MANKTSEEIDAITGSNLQICFVNEHHQANEALETDRVRKGIFVFFDYFIFVFKECCKFENKIEVR